MAFSPIPDGSMPSPDDVLARLAPGPGEGTTGYITKEDLAFAWQVFLSQAVNGKTLVQAVDSALIALTTRVAALEAAGGSFTTVPTAANLNAVATNGSISVALDTGQWFLRKNGAWTTLGLDVTGVTGALSSANAKIATLEAKVAALEAKP